MSKNQNITIQAIAVGVGVLLLVGKFIAYYITHSNTVLTDALESIINVVAGALGLYSLIIAAIPKDHNHPYGHGKVEFISAGIEGTLIALAGVVIILQSIYSLIYPNAIHQIDLGIWVAGVAGAINWVMGWMAAQHGKRTGSLALVASGKHLQSDAYSSVGMIVGLIVIWATQYVWLDSAVALLFGAIIGWTGIGIVRESVAGIMDEVDSGLMEQVVAILNTCRPDNWVDVHNLRIIKYGSSLHIDCHLTVPWYFNVVEAHHEVDILEETLRREIGGAVELFIHIDACVPTSCRLCQKADCPQRLEAFEGRMEWTPKIVMLNRKHGLEV